MEQVLVTDTPQETFTNPPGTVTIDNVLEDPTRPATQLVGHTLEGGWRVVRRIQRTSKATGGCFSVSYIVESPTHGRAFLKAIDYSGALASPDPARALQPLVNAFLFERDLCQKCKDRRLSRIVRPICDGSIQINANMYGAVQYIIFELAEADVRAVLDKMEYFDLAWILRTLHEVTSGLCQLHGIDVAHQDIKPSNVLIFPDQFSKLADLGCASQLGLSAPRDSCLVAGDLAYAPPERLFGYEDPEWRRRRLGCDAYLLGNLVVFLFSRTTINALAFSNLHVEHRHGGTFEDILPYLREAYARGLQTFGDGLPTPVRQRVLEIVMQLCDPDPLLRGHPKDRGSPTQYSLNRYVAEFDVLAKKAEYKLFGSVAE